MGASLKVMVLGIRGLPNVQGGVETHAEHLYPRLASLGCDVEAIVRTPFVSPEQRFFGPIRTRRLWAPRRDGFEALVHSLVGVCYAGITRPDILHIHCIGPAIVTPIARLFGLKVVVTHHGPDYDREKWGFLARCVLLMGERFGMRNSHERIAISRAIASLILTRHDRTSHLIPNGVQPAMWRADTTHVEAFGLRPARYFLQVSRMVPEKRQLDLIRAFAAARPDGWQLALVGALDNSSYSQAVSDEAKQAGVVLTGYLNGEPLQQMYSHAGAFILPSSHEGMPIALLEALSYGLPVLASDIPANLEINLGASEYFPLGDIASLAAHLTRLAATPVDEGARAARRQWVAQNFAWDRIAEQTLDVYRNLGKIRS
jgi:glycosyltransferase involved in cell wall biosynthesis